MELHHPGFEARYCGPTALCALSGKAYKEVRTVINLARGRPHNRGVCRLSLAHMRESIKLLGYTATELMPSVSGAFPTLRRWMAEHGHTGMWIIHVTGHYMAVCDGLISDSFAREPRPLRNIHRPKRKVKTVWRIDNI